jgi:DNA-binding MltR family transcriptional regulator
MLKTLPEMEWGLGHFLAALNEEKDFPCVLVATTFLDDALGAFLVARFADASEAETLVNRKGGMGGPLATFATRIVAAYCMGLISLGAFNDLNTIREIRNLFAHPEHPLDFGTKEIPIAYPQQLVNFGTDEVRKLCEQLTLPKSSLVGEQELQEYFHTPRQRFAMVVNWLFADIMTRRRNLERLPLMKDDWD